MFPFLFAMIMITSAGPGYIEGGFKASEQHGLKTSLERAWDERQPVDYSKMND